VLARPNARYDAIVPLRSESASWTNKFGATRNGYITYPRDHRPGQRHATVVITHASDARNLFAYDGFQWAFPLQVLAERGYLVLSVNERPADPQVSEAYASHRAKTSVERMQRGQGLEAVATMEAAVQSVVDRGVADPRRVGIAGYSRGGIVTTLTLSQSRMFKAGINADTGFFSAGGFWRSATVRELYRTLFGGPPLDPRFSDHYRAFSPSARADKFAGPLLQFFTGTNGQAGVELDQALKEAGVPTQLIVYPGETHVLHRPRTIESAMQCSLDWFDFWLNAREDPAASRIVQYERWRRLRQSQPRR
jgi:dipeptidyl aminopeptidase/acylaminoacyl peptidase